MIKVIVLPKQELNKVFGKGAAEDAAQLLKCTAACKNVPSSSTLHKTSVKKNSFLIDSIL